MLQHTAHHRFRRLLPLSGIPVPDFPRRPPPQRSQSHGAYVFRRKRHSPTFQENVDPRNFLASAARRSVTCFVADGLLSFTPDFCEENGIPLICFRPAPASYFWAIFHFPQLLQAQEIPFGGKSMDELIESIPGMEGFLRRRDLPSFNRVDDVNEPTLKEVIAVTMLIKRAQVAILNTCEDLEGQIVAEMHKHVPRVFSIGTIHEQVKYRLTEKEAESSIITASLWEEDRSCIDWLDAQPPKSVIYVSFGSLTLLTRGQVLEFLLLVGEE